LKSFTGLGGKISKPDEASLNVMRSNLEKYSNSVEIINDDAVS
jgi:hypothetical protein